MKQHVNNETRHDVWDVDDLELRVKRIAENYVQLGKKYVYFYSSQICLDDLSGNICLLANRSYSNRDQRSRMEILDTWNRFEFLEFFPKMSNFRHMACFADHEFVFFSIINVLPVWHNNHDMQNS